MNAIAYYPKCTYLRNEDRDELLRQAEVFKKRNFVIFNEQAASKGVEKKPKYYEVTMIPV